MIEFYKVFCNFCGEEIPQKENYFLECTCEGYKQAMTELSDEIEKEPTLARDEEYEKRYPQVYSGSKCINEKQNRFISLSVRKVNSSYGFCIFYPFIDPETGETEDAGMCFDMEFEDIPFMLELISESFIAISKDEKKDEQTIFSKKNKLEEN